MLLRKKNDDKNNSISSNDKILYRDIHKVISIKPMKLFIIMSFIT